eukprot:4738922-Pyramimonas_sp.AAC.1
MAGRSARTMSTACAASSRFAHPEWSLEVTSREGLSTRRNRCRSSSRWGPGTRSRSIFPMSALRVAVASASASSLSSSQGSSIRHGRPLIGGLWAKGSGAHAVAEAQLQHRRRLAPQGGAQPIEDGEAEPEVGGLSGNHGGGKLIKITYQRQMPARADGAVERHGCHKLVGLPCLVDDEQGYRGGVPEGLRGF